MDYVIRLAEEKDVDAFYSISLRSHTASYYDQLIPSAFQADFYAYYQWSSVHEQEFTANMTRKLAHPAWYAAVAECDGKVIGYTIAHSKIAGKLMLRGLFVDPVVHAKGIGTALFEFSLTWAQPDDIIELVVIDENIVARRLYERHGFMMTDEYDKDFFGAKMVRMQRLSD